MLFLFHCFFDDQDILFSPFLGESGNGVIIVQADCASPLTFTATGTTALLITGDCQ